MKKLLLGLISMLGLALAAQAQTATNEYSKFGKLLLVKLETAPFPHPQRAAGHKYGSEFYSTDAHYQDSTVGIFIPKGFRKTGRVDFVVHFHGWRNHVEKVVSQYKLIEQFAASGRNAILVVPQGPYDAPDSFDGKLEVKEGFQRFMAEVMETLRRNDVVQTESIGDIVLSGHSGGYQAISSIVAQGGLTDHIQEVWLFDALYAQTEKFTNWFNHQPGARMIILYTEHGGTKEETENLITSLRAQPQPPAFYSGKESEVALRQGEEIT